MIKMKLSNDLFLMYVVSILSIGCDGEDFALYIGLPSTSTGRVSQ